MKQKAVFVYRILLSFALSYFVFFALSDQLYARPECPKNIGYTSDMRIKCTADQGFPLKGALEYYGNAWEGTTYIGNIFYLAIDLVFAFVISYILIFFVLMLAKRFIKSFSARFPATTYFLKPNVSKISFLVILFSFVSYLSKGELVLPFHNNVIDFVYWGLPLPISSSTWSLSDMIDGISSSPITLTLDILFWYLIVCFLLLINKHPQILKNSKWSVLGRK